MSGLDVWVRVCKLADSRIHQRDPEHPHRYIVTQSDCLLQIVEGSHAGVYAFDPKDGTIAITFPPVGMGIGRRGKFAIMPDGTIHTNGFVGKPEPPKTPMSPEEFIEATLEPYFKGGLIWIDAQVTSERGGGNSVPQLTPEQVQQLSTAVAQYITAQREAYLPTGIPLTREQSLVVGGHFILAVLDKARLVVLQNSSMQNPNFYPQLWQLGFKNLPDFRTMAAITFGNVVVSRQPFTHGLLFHELVHVEQYRQLGIQRFSSLYVRGFLTGGGYEGIPLERSAYALGARFQANPRQQFSVSDEVTEWIRLDRF